MSALSLSLLGPFKITLNGKAVAASLWAKTQALLAYLAIETDTPHRRDHLAGLFWPDQSEESARHSLRQALYQLCQALGDDASSFLLITPQTVQFNPSGDHALDATEFSRLIEECNAHQHHQRETCRVCVSRLQRAIQLYRGDLLAELFLKDSVAFEEWALVKREQLRREATFALHSLAEYHALHGDYALMEQAARRQVEIDPFREDAHRQLMCALTWSGQRNAALEQYEILRRMLAQELNVTPDEETTLLHAQIKADTLVPRALPLLRNWPAAARLTSFVGREQELAQISECLQGPDVQLVTLVGPGGIGKTRLALRAAEQEAFAFRDGACCVPLADVSSGDSIAPAITRALQLSFAESSDPKAQFIQYLRDTKRDLLLVLDSMEHLVNESMLISDMLRACPTLKILVTSREGLNLAEEWRLPVHGLASPHLESLAQMETYSAVQLFLQRARQVRPDLALAEADRPAVARICQLVDGMPLGLELAAAWVKAFSCADIAREIKHNLDFLASSLRDVPERHHSVRATFEHSWNLLTDKEQRAFRRLSVFRGGFRREAAEAVLGMQWSAVSSQLVDKSLLQLTPAGHYEQHPLIHQYAAEKLAQWPHEQEQIIERHALYYASFLQRRGKHLKGVGQKQASAEIEEDIENVRAAWQWMTTRHRWFEIARCLEGLAYFYLARGWYREGAVVMGQSAAVMSEARGVISNPIRAIVRGSALVAQGMFCIYLGLFEQAGNLLTSGLCLLRPTRIRRLIALALGMLSLAELNQGQHDLAATHLREGLALARATREQWLVGVLLTFAGHQAQARDLAEAIGYYRESVAVFRTIDDRRTMATPLCSLGETLRLAGNLAEARQHLHECLAAARETDARQQAVWSLTSLGDIAFESGDYAEAQQCYQESLTLSREMGADSHTAVNQAGLAAVAWMLGDDAAAKAGFRKVFKWTIETQARSHLAGLGVRWAALLAARGPIEQEHAVEWLAQALRHPAIVQGYKLQAERLLERLSGGLPPDVFAAAWERGQARTLEAMVEEVLLPGYGTCP